MKAAVALASAALASLVSLPSPAVAAESFTGRCTLTGVVRFDPPLGMATQPALATAVLAGQCGGVAARYRATATGRGSCAGGVTTGAGTLALADGRRIDFRFSETRVAAVAAIRLTGAAGGSASGVAYARPDADAVAMVAQCAASDLAEIPVNATILATSTLSG